MASRVSLPIRVLLLLLVPLASACDPGDAPRGREVGSDQGLDSAATAGSDAPSGVTGPAPAPAIEPVRVVFFGTSLTAGLGLLRDSDRYTDRIAEYAASAELPVHVINAGVSGETSAGGLRRLDWALEEPVDVLVVELGANDGLRGQDPGAMETNLRTLVRRARERHPDLRVVLLGMEAPPNLGTAYTEAFRQVFPRLSREMDAELVPFLLEDVAGVDSLNQDDGIHPNPAGHRVMAATVWEVLEPVVEEVVRERRAGAPDEPVLDGGES